MKETKAVLQRGPTPAEQTSRAFYGVTYLFDATGNKLGITQDLKQSFPSIYRQILSIAYYLILEDSAPLFRFEKWGSLHVHPYGKNIASQRSSEVFSAISEEARNNFFRLQGKRRLDKEYCAYDTTSVSSYSEQSLDGKLFVQFIALIYLSYIKTPMQRSDLLMDYSTGTLLDKLDVIECFMEPGRRLRVGELLEKQKDIYVKLGIEPPSSL